MEQTLSIIKPDAVAKNVIGQIYSRFENAGLRIIRKGDKDYLIATNFNICESSNVRNECQRYNIAESILIVST